MYAINAASDSIAIQKLKQTWESINRKMQLSNEFPEIFSMQQNSAIIRLRTLSRQSPSP